VSREEKVFTVFVASPGDVTDERSVLEEVISEINMMWSRDLGIRLELVRWETHAIPGIGLDAQAVINDSIPNDYDLFVGIMWCRYGTPTGRAGSGTVEEFEIAKKRYESDPNSVKFMMYFKDAPISPSQMDPCQLTQVISFRNSLGAQGVLHWSFNSPEDFRRIFRIHIVGQIRNWTATHGKFDREDSKDSPSETLPESDELGYLDYIEIVEKSLTRMQELLDHISSHFSDSKFDFIRHLPNGVNTPINLIERGDMEAARKLVLELTTSMNEFALFLEEEVPVFNDTLGTAIDALVNAAELSLDLNLVAQDSLRSAILGNASILDSISLSIESFHDFRSRFASLPPLSRDFNKAKRSMVSAIDLISSEFSRSLTLIVEADKALAEISSIVRS